MSAASKPAAIEVEAFRLALDYALSYIETERAQLPPASRRFAKHRAIDGALLRVIVRIDLLRDALPQRDPAASGEDEIAPPAVPAAHGAEDRTRSALLT